MNDRLEQIEARADAASEGPWHAGRGATSDGTEFVHTYEQKTEFLALSLNSGRSYLWLVDNGEVIPAVTGDGPKAEANATFLAHAREDVPHLLAVVREQAAQLEGLRTDIQNAMADAWDEGFFDGKRYSNEGDDGPRFINPYRAALTASRPETES